MKNEPESYSIDDLKKDKKTIWDGIRNYQVRNMMRDEMKVGDRAIFYHSSTVVIGAAGVMEVVKAAYPDPTQFDKKDSHYDPKSTEENPRWLAVDVRFVEKFARIVPLALIAKDPVCKDALLVQKGNRLSVTPLTAKQFTRIVALAKK